MGTEPRSAQLNDYRARDYQSFRRFLLDRLNLDTPNWQERHVADQGIAIVELLAYVADYLSYYQDSVAAEAHLATARQRISVARHARALDYQINNGCNARAWIQFEAAADCVELPSRVHVYPDLYDIRAIQDQSSAAVLLDNLTFETMHPATARRAHNAMELYAGRSRTAYLEKGATSAALAGEYPRLVAGDVVILEEGQYPGGSRFRHAVRLSRSPVLSVSEGQPLTEIYWRAGDALPQAVQLSGRLPDGRYVSGFSVCRGNIVLADHGFTIEEPMPPAPQQGWYEPVLHIPNLTHAVLYDHASALQEAAAAAMTQSPRMAEPQIELREFRDDVEMAASAARSRWRARRGVLRRPRFLKEFAAEIGNSGELRLRFDHSDSGLRPSPAWRLNAIYRTGQGARGNVGPNALTRFSLSGPAAKGISAARNLLPAAGGVDPESLEQARYFAPLATGAERRCVTEADYERITSRFPGVRAVRAVRTELGARRLVYLYLDTTVALDDGFEVQMRRFLDPFRLIGDILELRPAQYVPLEIVVEIEPEAGRRPDAAIASVAKSLAGPDGYLAPGRLSFGASVYRSQLLDAIGKTPGVAGGDVAVLRRMSDREGLLSERIHASRFEILRATYPPVDPETGTLTVRALRAGESRP